MQKSILALDCDDVVFPFVNQLISYLNNEKGMNLKREDFNTYNLQKILGDKYFWQTIKKLNDFYRSPYFRQAVPVDGAVNVLDSLKKDYSIHLITSRPRILKEKTNIFLESFFPGIIDSKHFSKNNACYNGARKTKAQICLELGAKTIIEDCLEYAVQCAEGGINVLLLNTPWNQSKENSPLIKRVNNLVEARDYALSLIRA